MKYQWKSFMVGITQTWGNLDPQITKLENRWKSSCSYYLLSLRPAWVTWDFVLKPTAKLTKAPNREVMEKGHMLVPFLLGIENLKMIPVSSSDSHTNIVNVNCLVFLLFGWSLFDVCFCFGKGVSLLYSSDSLLSRSDCSETCYVDQAWPETSQYPCSCWKNRKYSLTLAF